MGADPAILIERIDGVTVWTLNRPATLNAISLEIKKAMIAGATEFMNDPEQRALVITGSGTSFCAGGDLGTMDPAAGPVATRKRLEPTHEFVRLLKGMEKPIISAVNGAAVGAGAALALLGDIVIAGEGAYFQAGFPWVGALPDIGLLHSLPRAVGMPKAMDFVLTNRRTSAAEALDIGLVSRVIPDDALTRTALEIADQLARGPSVSLGLSKRLMQLAMTETLESFLTQESMGQAVAFSTDDFAEGLAAFREKRAPRFSGR